MNSSTTPTESSACPCFDEIIRGETTIQKNVIRILLKLGKYTRRFHCEYWSFLGSRLETTWYKTYSHKSNGKWNSTAAMMILSNEYRILIPQFLDHPSSSERGKLDIKGIWQEIYPIRRQ